MHAQSSDIAQGVDSAGNKDEGAGDQGIVGYVAAKPRTDAAPLYYAHRILKLMATPAIPAKPRPSGPDAKSRDRSL